MLSVFFYLFKFDKTSNFVFMKISLLYLGFLFAIIFLLNSCKKTEKEYWDNGQIKSSIEYKDGEKHGKAIYYFKNGSKQNEFIYESGILEGVSLQWNYNGVLLSSIEFSNDMMNGEAIYYDDEGKKLEILHYKNDIIEGKYLRFYPNGEKKIEGFYKEGSFDGEWKYYDYTSILIGEASFNNGSGVQKAYYRNGKIKRIIHYENSMKNGAEIWYAEDGSVNKHFFYENDKLIRQN